MKKFICITLALVMVLSVMSVGAVAPTRTPKAMVNFLTESFTKNATGSFALNLAESGGAAHKDYNFAYLKRKSAAYITTDIMSLADEIVLTFDAMAEKAAAPFLVTFKAPADSHMVTKGHNYFTLKFTPAVFVDGEALKADNAGKTVAAVTSWGGDGKLKSDWYTFKVTLNIKDLKVAKNDAAGNIYDLNVANCLVVEKKAKGAADSTYVAVAETPGSGPVAYQSEVRPTLGNGGFNNCYTGTDYTLGFGVLNGGTGGDYVLYNDGTKFATQGETTYCVDNVSIDYMGTQSAKYAKTSGILADVDYENYTVGDTSLSNSAGPDYITATVKEESGDKYLEGKYFGSGGKNIILSTPVPNLDADDFSASIDIYKETGSSARDLYFIGYEDKAAGKLYGYQVLDADLPEGAWYTFRMDSKGNIMKKLRDDASAQWTTVTPARHGNVNQTGSNPTNAFWVHTKGSAHNVNDVYRFDNIRVGKLTTASVETSSKTASSASAKVHVVDANKTAAASATITTILAVYNGDVLVDVMYVDAPATKGYATAELELEAAGNKAKIYVWDTFASGTPRLAAPIEL